jgi:uncharacterized protein (TIGR02117 family)
VKLIKRLGVNVFKINSGKALCRAVIGWLLLVIGLYMAAALLGSLFPLNTDWQESQTGTQIYIYDNGIHTSIILPNTEQTAPQRFPGDDFLADRTRYPWVAIGWGDREFYLNTPSWSDLSPSIAVTAFVGSGQSLIHEDRLKDLKLVGEVKAIRLNAQEFERLTANINAMRTPNAIAGYGQDDRFFEARPVHDYSIVYTCNNWVAGLLASAGVKTGRWTPLPFGVMWWYKAEMSGY